MSNYLQQRKIHGFQHPVRAFIIGCITMLAIAAIAPSTHSATHHSDTGAGLFELIIVLLLYMLPTIVAKLRHHRQIGTIGVVNFFLGWTFIGWVVALAMACSATSPQTSTAPAPKTHPGW